MNILGFWEPFRELVKMGVQAGFIQPQNADLVQFVNGPKDHAEHDTFNWGQAALEAIDGWAAPDKSGIYDWTKRKDRASENIGAI